MMFNFWFKFLCILPSPSHAMFRPILPRLGCFLRFGLLRFDITNFDRYPRYFRDDSAMTLAQTGTYKGAAEIEEYVQFATVSSPFIDAVDFRSIQTKFAGYDRRRKICTFNVMYDAFDSFNPNLTSVTGDDIVRIANFVKIEFNFRKRYIRSIYVYYTDTYLSFFLGNLTNTDETRAFVCDVYEGPCAAILDTPDDCEGRLLALSESNDGIYADGDTQSCRILHSVFAATNDRHCAHLSFDAMEDYLGRVKCNQSEGLTPDLFFNDGDLDQFRSYMVDLGQDPDIGYMIQSA